MRKYSEFTNVLFWLGFFHRVLSMTVAVQIYKIDISYTHFDSLVIEIYF